MMTLKFFVKIETKTLSDMLSHVMGTAERQISEVAQG